MKGLTIAEGLTLPLDAATRRMAVLAMSGAGKSNLAVVLAEQMHAAGIPWVAIDPKGDWWGVRSNGNGKGAGLPVPILGGLHADVPLEPRGGKLVGELIVDERLTCVLDVSEFDDRQAMWGFLIDLGETLLRRNRAPLHVFIEEADEVLPQKASEKGNLPKCLGVWQRVVKRGRFRGIGTTQITQRSASLNKDTLYQAEALFALRCAGKGDRQAIEGWVEHNRASGEIVASLPSLADGEGWVSSPAWLKIARRVRFDRRRTFDSGETPFLDANVGGRKPATLADVDLAALTRRMASTIERAKADDPKALRAEIAQLRKDRVDAERLIRWIESSPRALIGSAFTAGPERQIAYAVEAILADASIAERIEVPVLDQGTAAGLDAVVENLRRVTQDIERQLAEARALAAKAAGAPPIGRSTTIRQVVQEPRKPAGGAGAPRRPLANGHDTGALGRGGDRRMLIALAQFPAGMTASKLSLLSGIARTGGTFRTYLGKLKTAGFVEGGSDRLCATPAGVAALGDYEPLPTGPELIDYWRRELGESGMRTMFDAFVKAYPATLTKSELAARTNIAESGGTFRTYLGKLKTLELVTGKREMQASEDLFA